MSLKKALLAASISGLLFSPMVMAHKTGDVIVRAGPILVDPQDSSGAIAITSPDLGAVTGSKVGVNSDTQLGLSFTYMVQPHLGVELLAVTPFSHDIKARGNLSGVGKLGSTKQLPPTLTLQYYPMSASSDFQPYLGVGINYTHFFDEQTTPTLTGSIGTLAHLAAPGTFPKASSLTASGTDLSLKDSVGPAAEIGADYKLTDRLGLNAGIWWANITTKATIHARTNAGPVTARTDVNINPLVYMAGIYYRF